MIRNKLVFISFLTFMVNTSLISQDTLYNSDNEKLIVKILEIDKNKEIVKYQIISDPYEFIYIILIKNIKKIVYANGSPAILTKEIKVDPFTSYDAYDKTDITDLVKFSFFSSGISYEKRVGKFQSLYVSGFMSFGMISDNNSFAWFAFNYYYDPAIITSYRYYYNAKGRANNGKRTYMNNMNYISPLYKCLYSKRPLSFYEEKKYRIINSVGFAFGSQRNYKNRFSADFSFGGAYMFTKSTRYYTNNNQIVKDEQFNVFLKLDLGIWLNKRK